jgi:hypothetical protein
MQEVAAPRKIKAPISRAGTRHGPSVQENADEVLHFSLQGLLAAGHTLALNTTLGTLAHLMCKDNLPYLVIEQQFTNSELFVLKPLLESYPYYCPYEVLCASFHSGRINETTVARSRQRLQEALEAGVWDQEMRPVRNVLSRTRIKTRTLGIEISSIFETGYILISMQRNK